MTFEEKTIAYHKIMTKYLARSRDSAGAVYVTHARCLLGRELTTKV